MVKGQEETTGDYYNLEKEGYQFLDDEGKVLFVRLPVSGHLTYDPDTKEVKTLNAKLGHCFSKTIEVKKENGFFGILGPRIVIDKNGGDFDSGGETVIINQKNKEIKYSLGD